MRFDPISFALGKQGDPGAVGDLVSYLLGRASGVEVWESITNVSVATFSAVSSTLRALAVDITAQQSGSGDPSPTNIRPISGWSSINVIVSPTLEAQDGTTYPISLGSGAPYYGGVLDVITGVLTVTHKIVDLGSLAWARNGTYVTLYSTSITDVAMLGGNELAAVMCSHYKPTGNASWTSGGWGSKDNYSIGFLTDGQRLCVKDNNYTDGNTFKEAVRGVKLVYLLASPVSVQLSATEVSAIIGQNNVWADSGIINTITYRAQ